MTTHFTIRAALPTADDLDLVVPLFEQYRQHFGSPPDQGGARCFIEDRLRGRQSVILLALQGQRSVGFVQLYPSFSSLAIAPIWVLNDLFVAPAARRQGIARALMQAAQAHARDSGAVRIFLETGQTNRAAQTLYEGLGYHLENETVRFYVLPVS
jgi:ribosomal protein S18 acetylase RimI-like enzyme